MSDISPNLELPYLIASQAQKHVTFNELINKLDALLMLSVISKSLETPPENPNDGQRYIIPINSVGLWQNKAGKIATWQNLGWVFMTPKSGYIAFIEDENNFYFYNQQWVKLSQDVVIPNIFNQLGICTNADNNNPFSAKLNNALFAAKYTAENGDGNLRLKINKENLSNTASILYQDNWSGRAELGLIGNDNFAIKISSDGANWLTPINIDAAGTLNFIALNTPQYSHGMNTIIKQNGTRFLCVPKALNTDGNNYFIGLDAGSTLLTYSTSSVDGSYNIGIGSNALKSLTIGNRNVGIGASALYQNNTGIHNIAIGHSSMVTNTSGAGNVALGSSSLALNQTGSSNLGLGVSSLNNNTTGSNNVGIGATCALNNTTGSSNVCIGQSALFYNISGNYNTSIGAYSLRYKIDGTNNDSYNYCTGIGYDTRVSASNQIQLGGSGTTTYAYGAVQDRSDIRDKADIRDTILGLEFICSLRPVDFRWDMRDDYFERIKTIDGNDVETEILKPIPKDGSKKRNRFHHGLVAQEVEQVLDNLNLDFGGFQNHAIKGGADILSIGYTELIAPLIKAVQQLNDEITTIKQSL